MLSSEPSGARVAPEVFHFTRHSCQKRDILVLLSKLELPKESVGLGRVRLWRLYSAELEEPGRLDCGSAPRPQSSARLQLNHGTSIVESLGATFVLWWHLPRSKVLIVGML